eukprot:96781-Chlamydomonas_euryale.AAC.1
MRGRPASSASGSAPSCPCVPGSSCWPKSPPGQTSPAAAGQQATRAPAGPARRRPPGGATPRDRRPPAK